MQVRLLAWLLKHGLAHRFLGFNYQGIDFMYVCEYACDYQANYGGYGRVN